MVVQKPTASARKRKRREKKGGGAKRNARSGVKISEASCVLQSLWLLSDFHPLCQETAEAPKKLLGRGHSQTAPVPFGGALANFRLAKERWDN